MYIHRTFADLTHMSASKKIQQIGHKTENIGHSTLISNICAGHLETNSLADIDINNKTKMWLQKIESPVAYGSADHCHYLTFSSVWSGSVKFGLAQLSSSWLDPICFGPI